MADLLRILFNSLQTGSTYALAALGIALIWKTSRTTNFAQGAIGTLGAYIAGVLLLQLGLSIWLVALISLVAAFFIGILIDTVIIRPAAKVGSVSKQIITLGLIMVIIGLIPLVFGVDPYRIPSFIPDATVDIGGATLRWNTVFVIAVSLGLMAFLFWFITKTRWGLAIRVTAMSESTAKLMGVPTRVVTMFSWASAAAMGTLAALIVAPQGSVNPNMLLDVQVSAFFAGVLGGFTTFAGPVAGAFIIALARNLTAFYLSDIWGNVIVYSLILLFLYFRPYGLLGKKVVKKV